MWLYALPNGIYVLVVPYTVYVVVVYAVGNVVLSPNNIFGDGFMGFPIKGNTIPNNRLPLYVDGARDGLIHGIAIESLTGGVCPW